MRKSVSNNEVRKLLADLSRRYDRSYLKEDPIFFAHQYSDPKDQEIAGLLSALLAFGNVKAIHQSIEKLLHLMGPHPAEFIQSFDEDLNRELFTHLGHRWVRGHDLHLLFRVLQKILGETGSVKNFFLLGYDPAHEDVGPMLSRVSSEICGMTGDKPLTRGFRFFFPSPEKGSPCKRMCMFLRWMVRPKDGLDLGLWPEIPTSKLVIPLDTHIYRFARKYRLSRYKNPRWEMARDVTRFLKTIDPDDPVRFDFAICHYGMEEGWLSPSLLR